MDKKLAIVTTSLVLFSGAALAIPTHKDFLALDADKDGYLSTEEYQGYQNSLQKDFGQADVSQDGKVSLDEFKASSKIWNDPFAGAGNPLTPPGGLTAGAAVSESRVTGTAEEDTSGTAEKGTSGEAQEDKLNKEEEAQKSVKGAETSSSGAIQEKIQKDVDKPGMMQEDVMESTEPKVLQGETVPNK